MVISCLRDRRKLRSVPRFLSKLARISFPSENEAEPFRGSESMEKVDSAQGMRMRPSKKKSAWRATRCLMAFMFMLSMTCNNASICSLHVRSVLNGLSRFSE